MRVKAGVSVIDLSKMAGTSVNHIENTYLKYSEEMALESAMKNFTVNFSVYLGGHGSPSVRFHGVPH